MGYSGIYRYGKCCSSIYGLAMDPLGHHFAYVASFVKCVWCSSLDCQSLMARPLFANSFQMILVSTLNISLSKSVLGSWVGGEAKRRQWGKYIANIVNDFLQVCLVNL